MTTRLFMVQNLLTVLASLYLLPAVVRHRRPALGLYVVAEAVFSVAAIAWSPSFQTAYIRECCYGVMLAFVALEVWSGLHRSSYVRRADPREALRNVLAILVLGFLAMKIPGAHPDYRGLVPVVLASAMVLACAVRAADFSGDVVGGSACTWFALVQVALVLELVAHEWSLRAFFVLGWVQVLVYVWATLEVKACADRTHDPS
jgi:hypothetical protein